MHKTIRRLIGLYQLLTGGYGCLFLVYSILLAGGGSLGALLILGLCILTAAAGMRLWNGRPGGQELSLLAQAAQSVSLSAGWLRYLFNAGLALWLNFGGGVHFDHDFGTRFRFGLASGFEPGSQPYPYAFGLNLLPLAIVLYLVLTARSSRKNT